MKAPETIFLRGYSFDDKPCKDWTLEPSKRGMRGYVVQNEKYIRKDALLEWAKKKVNEIEIAMETGADDPVLWGQRNAFKQVIDKINSM